MRIKSVFKRVLVLAIFILEGALFSVADPLPSMEPIDQGTVLGC